MKIGFFQAYGRMWARVFDYKSEANRCEFWYPTILHVALMQFAAVLLLFVNAVGSGYIFLWILLVTITLIQVPYVALTVRRLKSAGHKGVWAALLLAAGIGTLILLYLCSADTSAFDPSFNESVTVYGPPEWFEDDPDYDPSENIQDDVYGPPEWFEDEEGYADEQESNP